MVRVGRVHVSAAVCAAGLLWWSWREGVQHDFGPYLRVWESALDGWPWTAENTYGPLFVVFAPLARLWWWLPKGLFVAAFLVGAAVVGARVSRWGSGWVRWLPWLLVANPMVVWLVGSYGLNDGLVAGLVAVAAVSRADGRDRRAGLLLGLAALVKFYPLLFAVLFAVPFRRRDCRVVGWAAGVFGAGMGLALVVSGWGALDAVRVGGGRPPKLLSVFAVFDVHSGWWGAGVAGWLARWNWVLVVLVVAGCVLVGLRLGWSWLEVSVVGVAVMLVVYKVGHPQFWLPWMVLLPLVAVEGVRGWRLVVWMAPWLLFLAVFQVGYWRFDWFLGSWGWVRGWVGLAAPVLVGGGLVGWWRGSGRVGVG